MININSKNNFFLFVFILMLLFIIYGGLVARNKNISFSLLNKLREIRDKELMSNYPQIQAISALVGEINKDDIFFEKNTDLHLFPASLVKLITAMVVIDHLDLEEDILISRNAINIDISGNHQIDLKINEKIKTKELLKALLISSSNSAAIAFSEHLGKENFVNLMNKTAKKWGLEESAFFEPSGLKDGEIASNFTTAKDLFKLATVIYKHYPLIGEITREVSTQIFSTDGKIEHQLVNTNILIPQIDNFWGGKTGFTTKAGECLLVIYELDTKNGKIALASIVLDSPDRFGDTLNLYYWLKNLSE